MAKIGFLTFLTQVIIPVVFIILVVTTGFGLRIYNLNQIKMENARKTELRTNIDKARCIFFKDAITPIFAEFGSNFAAKDFSDALEKNNTVQNVILYNNSYNNEINMRANLNNSSLTYDDNSSYLNIAIMLNSYCTFKYGNCYTYISDTCRFYFDDNGRILPSKKTSKFINIK